jgi:hypothetical protein
MLPELGVHPPAGPSFAHWFSRLEGLLGIFRSSSILTAEFAPCIASVLRLVDEVAYELGTTTERKGSVYDRPDYLVRELLRTGCLGYFVNWARQTAHQLRDGPLELTAEGILMNHGNQVPPDSAAVLLIHIPSTLVLCFTAEETVGTVSIDNVLNIVADTCTVGTKSMPIALQTVPPQRTLFQAAPALVTACIGRMQVLNTGLFFSEFRSLRLFAGLVQLALAAAAKQNKQVRDAALEAINTYIPVSQSEGDRKEMMTDPTFVALYRKMMAEIIDPLLKENRENRGKSRSILFFSRSLKG